MANPQGTFVDLTPDVHGYTAASDLTSYQFRAVVPAGTDGTASNAGAGTSTHGVHPLGINVGEHNTGEAMDIRSGPLVPATLNGNSVNITQGMKLKTTTGGILIPAQTTGDIACYEYADADTITADGKIGMVRRIAHTLIA